MKDLGKPDIVELLTSEQLSEAASAWLLSKGRVEPAKFKRVTLVVSDDGRHEVQFWREP